MPIYRSICSTQITASLIILNGDVNEKRQSEVECSVVGPVFFLFFVFFCFNDKQYFSFYLRYKRFMHDVYLSFYLPGILIRRLNLKTKHLEISTTND